MAVTNIYEKPLREYMDRQGLTQTEFSKTLGIAQSKLSDILNGYVSPKPELVEIITQKTGIIFQKPAEPLETVPIEIAAYELGMSAENLKVCLREKVFDYQFGVKAPGFNRYTIWRTKLDRFKKM